MKNEQNRFTGINYPYETYLVKLVLHNTICNGIG
jgi:hypothetical protein